MCISTENTPTSDIERLHECAESMEGPLKGILGTVHQMIVESGGNVCMAIMVGQPKEGAEQEPQVSTPPPAQLPGIYAPGTFDGPADGTGAYL